MNVGRYMVDECWIHDAMSETTPTYCKLELLMQYIVHAYFQFPSVTQLEA